MRNYALSGSNKFTRTNSGYFLNPIDKENEKVFSKVSKLIQADKVENKFLKLGHFLEKAKAKTKENPAQPSNVHDLS
ncbi:hypothetical protein [Piscirickettsia litoralis]|uniref:Uncharacterized protein n=1 Tax=Piscirickettsia litoralis TaxID=1891921 RepID=A0ABX3A4U2_9GAMM|nr:hypothetical protein [Piscirickettsia litoralis]ODN43877.1 hypothetical protein BGC07_14495 [Piscirickettsia litoralis]